MAYNLPLKQPSLVDDISIKMNELRQVFYFSWNRTTVNNQKGNYKFHNFKLPIGV